MSKYSVNDTELLKAKQLLVHVENKLYSVIKKIESSWNGLEGQTGYGIEQERYKLSTQKAVIQLQVENITKLKEYMQNIIDTTVLAGHGAKMELESVESEQSLEESEIIARAIVPGAEIDYAAGLFTAETIRQGGATFYEYAKGIRKGISGSQDILEMLQIGANESEALDNILHTPFFDGIGKIAKAEKIYTAIQEGDGEELVDMVVEKYAKANGVEGFKFEGYYTMAKVWGKNAYAYWEKCQTEEVTLGDRVAAFWSLTGGMLVESGCEIAYDKLTSIVPWYDEYYGGDVSGFYEKVGEIKDSIKDAYGIKGIGDGIVKIGKNTVSFYAEKISNLFQRGA